MPSLRIYQTKKKSIAREKKHFFSKTLTNPPSCSIINKLCAGVAQVVVQLIRNQQVAGSSPFTSSKQNPLSQEGGFYFLNE